MPSDTAQSTPGDVIEEVQRRAASILPGSAKAHRTLCGIETYIRRASTTFSRDGKWRIKNAYEEIITKALGGKTDWIDKFKQRESYLMTLEILGSNGAQQSTRMQEAARASA